MFPTRERLRFILAHDREANPMRYATVICHAVSISCLFVWSGQSRGQVDETLLHSLRTEAPRRWSEYERLVLQMQGKVSFVMKQTMRSIVAKNETSFRSNGSSKVITLSMSRMIDGKKDYDTEEAVGINSRYGFQLRRKSKTAPWVLVDLVQGVETFGQRSFKEHYGPTSSLVHILNQPLAQFVAMPDFKLLSLRSDTGGLIELKFETRHKPDETSNPAQSGKILLDPNRYWTVKSYEVDFESSRDRGKITFQASEIAQIDGIPIPKSTLSRTHVEFSDGSKNDQTHQIEFDLSKSHSSDDESEFTLSAFGLPEPYGIRWKRRIPIYQWLLLAAGVVAGLALGVHVVSRHRRNSTGA